MGAAICSINTVCITFTYYICSTIHKVATEHKHQTKNTDKYGCLLFVSFFSCSLLNQNDVKAFYYL